MSPSLMALLFGIPKGCDEVTLHDSGTNQQAKTLPVGRTSTVAAKFQLKRSSSSLTMTLFQFCSTPNLHHFPLTEELRLEAVMESALFGDFS